MTILTDAEKAKAEIQAIRKFIKGDLEGVIMVPYIIISEKEDFSILCDNTIMKIESLVDVVLDSVENYVYSSTHRDINSYRKLKELRNMLISENSINNT